MGWHWLFFQTFINGHSIKKKRMYELSEPVFILFNRHAALVRCATQNTHAQHKTKPKFLLGI